ncbi:hypothetical protein JI57_04565 [Psychromonas sp. PRT-SC03]|nr:hypothetical protein JI57_04565 [Psychromonas sp. PRT-SC03]
MNREYPLYEGSVHEIDMAQEWYCPHCLSKLLFVSHKSHDLLSCHTYYEECDYEYANKKGRDQLCFIWLKGYLYPLTRLEVISKLSQALISQRKRLNVQLRINKEQLNKMKEEVINLSSKFFNSFKELE